MRAIVLLSALGLLSATRVHAQYVPDTTHRCISDVFLSLGGQAESGGWISLDEIRAGAPGSTLLAGDLSGHDLNIGMGQGAGVFHSALGLSLRENRAKGTSVKLRAGLSFAQFFSGEVSLRKSERFPHDTLVSSGSGEYTYIDSVSTSTYIIRHRHQRVGVDLALLFVKDFPGHWMLYGGAGATVGATLAGITHIEHHTENYIEGQNGEYYSTHDLWTNEEENVRTKGAFFVNAHLPLGVGYRLAKRNPFWRSLLLTMEMQPALTIGGEPSDAEQVRTGFNFLFGLRVDLNQ